jgi:hypothetical protein
MLLTWSLKSCVRRPASKSSTADLVLPRQQLAAAGAVVAAAAAAHAELEGC